MSTSASPNHVYYVHCNFCNTVLVVSVPAGASLCSIMTVRCGHCSNILSVNMGGLLQSAPELQDLQKFQGHNPGSQGSRLECESSSRCNRISLVNSMGSNLQDITPSHPSQKRQRVPSAYNRFIKEEIRRLKTTNPDISHRQAFSAAAKNWAHFPRIHFSLNHDGKKRVKIDDPIAGQGGHESQSYY